MMRRIMILWGTVWAAWLCLAIPARANDRLPVFVSIVPQQYFVEQIGGDRVDVRIMVRPGASPATYEPKPRQMTQLARTRIYFAVGVPFERVWLPKIAAANPAMAVVHTDQGIPKRPMALHPHDHHHEPERVHPAGSHGEAPPARPDPHIWLSPPLAKLQAGHILKALTAADPAHGADYRANHDRFLDALDRLDDELRTILTDTRGKAFMVFHPSWGYFADSYGLVQIPIEVEGKTPKAAELESLIQEARQRDIRTIFVQPQFSDKSARLIAGALNAAVVPADPLAPDWADNLRRVARQFQAAAR